MEEEKYVVKEIVVERPKIEYLTMSNMEELVKRELYERGIIKGTDQVEVEREEWSGEKEIYFSYPFKVFKKEFLFEGEVLGKSLSPKGEDIKEMIIKLKLPKERATLEKVS
jgi:hypothetical protein